MSASVWAFTAALLANPVTWVVVGIVALIGAIGAAIYYWDEIKASFMDTAVFKFLADTIDWVIDKLNMIPGIDIDVGTNMGEMPTTPELESALKVSPMVEAANLEGGWAGAFQDNEQNGTGMFAYKQAQNKTGLPSGMVRTPPQSTNNRQETTELTATSPLTQRNQ